MNNFRHAAIATSLVLSACVTVPSVAPPHEFLADSSLGLTAGVSAPKQVPDWWTTFGDAQLDRLMQEALSHNPNLAQAMARMRKAQAMAELTGSLLYPSVSYDAQEIHQRFSGTSVIPPPFAGGTYWQGTQGLNLSWNLDFWDRQSSLLKQASSQSAAATLDVASARLALSGAVVQIYVDLYRNYALSDLAKRSVAQHQQILNITNRRVSAGLDTKTRLSEADGAISQAQVELRQLQAVIELDIHRLAELSGHGASDYSGIERPHLDPSIALPLPVELPTDLLGRRPDVLAARNRVDAASAGQAAAKSAFYPDINLAAFVATSAIGYSNLFKSASETYGIGPAIHLPIFDAGGLKARYRGATAEIDEAVNGYNAVVLQAVKQVSDQLSMIRALDTELVAQQKLLNAAEITYHLVEEQYHNGLVSNLTLLNAETQVLSARRQRVELVSAQAVARINLLLAVGGSFDPNAPLPL